MKIRFIFGLAMLMTVAGSCKKNEEKETNSFTASIEVDESSKTSLNGNKVFWETGDQIMVYNDNASHVYTLSGNGPTQLGTFTTTGGLQPTTSSYWGVYPYNSCTALNRGNDQFTFSFNASSQPYTSSGFADELNPMAGKNTNPSYPTRLYFRNAFSVLKIVATGNDCAIDAIELTTNGSNNSLTGTFVYDYGNQTLSLSSGTGNTITLTGISKTLSSSEETFYFVVPPTALANGFTITYKNGTSTVDTKTVDASTVSSHYNLAPNKMLSLTMRVEAAGVRNLLPETKSDVGGTFNYTWFYVNSHGELTNKVNIVNPQYMLMATSYPDLPSTLNNTNSIVVTTQSTRDEGYIFSKDVIHFDNTHTYYLRWYTLTQLNITGNKQVTHDCYWPIAEPVFIGGSTCVQGRWKMHSAIREANTTSHVSGDYQVRFDINNQQYVAGGIWNGHHTFAGAMLIDLTEAGLAGLSQAQLDAKPYFYGITPTW